MTTEELETAAFQVDCTKANHKMFAWQLKLICLLLANLIYAVVKLTVAVERNRP